jgi:hypothetical protein
MRISGALESPNQIGFTALVAAFGLAWLTYRFVEKPLRFHGKNVPAKSSTRRPSIIEAKVAGLLVGMLLLFVGGNVIYLTDGNVYRRDNKVASLPPLPDPRIFNELKIFEHWTRPDTSCQDHLRQGAPLPEEVCVANSSRPKVLFLGDSHAMALYSSIFAKHIDIPSVLIASPGCLIYPNFVYKPKGKEWGQNCTQIAVKGLHLAGTLETIDTVVISTVRKENYADKLTQFYSGGTALTDHEAFVLGTEYLVNSLMALGKHVIYVADVPYFPGTPENCQTKFLITKKDQCVIDKAVLDGAFPQYFETINAIKGRFPKLEIFDAAMVVCDDGKCAQHDGSQYFYIDRDHLSVYGSEKVLNRLLERFPLK